MLTYLQEAIRLGLAITGLTTLLGTQVYARRDPIFLSPDPYPFEENRGQLADPTGRPLNEVYFTFSGPGVRGYITRWGLTLYFFRTQEEKQKESPRHPLRDEPEEIQINWERIDIELVEACIDKERLRAHFPGPGANNYYLAHCPQGILGVRQYAEVRAEGIWPGVDWVLRYDERIGGIKQEFVLQAGVSPDRVRLRLWSRNKPEITPHHLRVPTAYGEITESHLLAYYGTEKLPLRYQPEPLQSHHNLFYQTFTYHISGLPNKPARTLLIDPVLQWGTYFGGNGADNIRNLAVDNNGNLFVVGSTGSSNTTFPLQDPGNPAYYDGTLDGTVDAFIAKFQASNLQRVWCTYYGGSGNDRSYNIAIDGSGDIFMVGATFSGNFPTLNLANAYNDATCGGCVNNKSDGFIVKFRGNDLSRLWATYFGGDHDDEIWGIAIAANNDLFIAGETRSRDNFPVYDPPGGSEYYDGTCEGCPATLTSNDFPDAFIAKFDGTNHARVWCTYFGGNNQDWAYTLAIAPNGDIFMAGETDATMNFPAKSLSGAYNQATCNSCPTYTDAYIARFSGNTLQLLWSTHFGGNREDNIISLSIGSNGDVFAGGITQSTSNFPLQDPGGGAYYSGTCQGCPNSPDAFIAKFSGSTLDRVWVTYYGSTGTDVLTGEKGVRVGSTFLAIAMHTNGTIPVSNYPSSCPNVYFQNTNGGSNDLAILTFELDGKPIWRTLYGGSGDEASRAGIALYSTYLYVTLNSTGNLTNARLPNTIGAAYHDNSHNGGGTDGVILRFDQSTCPLWYGRPVEEEPGSGGISEWRAWWDGEHIRLTNIEEPSWYSLIGVEGRLLRRWYVSGREAALEAPETSGLYVLHEERTGSVRRVWIVR